MSLDAVPIWALLAATILLMMIAVEVGYSAARREQRRLIKEKLPPVSSIVASTLALVAFMLAFTFGTVSSRYDARKALVRDEANVIRTVWLRTDFLPEPDRGETAMLIRTYLDQRVAAAESGDGAALEHALAESIRIQHRLWDIAVENARRAVNLPVVSLFVASLNQMLDLHALRVVIGLEARVPVGIWMALYTLIVLGMMGIGYQNVIAEGAGRSRAPLLLAFSFSVVLALIAALDRPTSGFMTVSQQPLKDVQIWMDAGAKPVASPGGIPTR